MQRRFFAAALTAFCFATTAHAGVGPYEWGTPLAEVVQLGAGDIRLIQGEPGDRVFGSDLRAEGAYSAAGIVFRGQFYFDPGGRLSAIRLHPQSMSDCERLGDVLEGLYGLGDSTGLGYSWIDTANNNDLRFTSTDGECFVAYRPITRAGGLGL